MTRKICPWCKTEFSPKRPEQLCCSLSCASKRRWANPDYKKRVVTKMAHIIRQRYIEGYVDPRKGKKLSSEHIAKMKIGMKGRISWNKGIPRTKEIKEMLSKVHKGKVIPEDVRRHISVTMKKVAREHDFGKHFEATTPEAEVRRAKKLSKSAKELNFARHFIVGRTVSPNKAEKQFISLCEKHNLPFKFTGDGAFWIENINPDFVEVNGRKIAVDIFGDYWHTPLFVGKALVSSRTEEGRKAIAKAYGWKLVIIWHSEFGLPDFEERILRKLRKVGIKI